MPTLQLRDYRIVEGHLDDFVAAWRSSLRPLRERLGFTVPEAWTIAAESRFIWILAHEGSQADFEERDQAYYASPDRRAIEPDPAQWIAEARHSFLDPVD
jgi:hypothetical protein